MIITFDAAFEKIRKGEAVYQGYIIDDEELFALVYNLDDQTTNHVLDEDKVFENIFWKLEGKSSDQTAKCAHLTENDKLFIDRNKNHP
ncbi:MAG: hypothetical protein LBH42_06600 [Treponema sp.]|jgi:hypothetical protein|nr:hypothetical protein [Treponema sp.]